MPPAPTDSVIRSHPLERLARLLPFGLGWRKPKHFRDMLVIAWRNRDNPAYAWQVLTRGVCNGCAPSSNTPDYNTRVRLEKLGAAS